MDLAEWEEGSDCAECGEPVARGIDEAFQFGERMVLCFGCATQRGGVYDAERDTWVTPPNLTGLDDRGSNGVP